MTPAGDVIMQGQRSTGRRAGRRAAITVAIAAAVALAGCSQKNGGAATDTTQSNPNGTVQGQRDLSQTPGLPDSGASSQRTNRPGVSGDSLGREHGNEGFQVKSHPKRKGP